MNKSNEFKKQHDFWYDNIKGILMIAVVVGHMIAQLSRYSSTIAYMYNFINVFHMGTFFILSGFMSKRRIEQKDYISVINKNIIPYMSAQLLLYFAAVILPEGLRAANSTYFNRSSFSFFLPVYQLWYLMGIIIFVIFSAKVQPQRHPIAFYIGSVIMSLLCGYSQQINVFKLTKVISFYPLFLLGYLLPIDFMKKMRNKWQICIVSICVWIVYICFILNDQWSMGIGSIYGLSTSYEECELLFMEISPMVGRLLFLLLVPVIAFAFYSLCPRQKTVFSKLGQNSMYIFVLHTLVVVPVRCLHYKYNIMAYCNTPVRKLIYLAFSVMITFILGSDWIKKIFRPILAPDIDIRKVVSSLCNTDK